MDALVPVAADALALVPVDPAAIAGDAIVVAHAEDQAEDTDVEHESSDDAAPDMGAHATELCNP